MKFLLLILAVAPLFAGTQSLVNQSSAGNFVIPNSAPFTTNISFFADMRFSGVALPSVCNASMFGSGTFQSSGIGIRICNPETRGTGAFQLWGAGPGLGGGPDAEMMWPNQSIIAITASATAPEIFFSSAPFPISFAVGQQTLINGGTGGAGNLPGGCAGLEGLQTITAVHPTSIVVSANASGCVYASGAVALTTDWRARIQWDNTAGQLRQEVWNVDGTGYAVNTVAIPTGELTATYPQTLSNGDMTGNVAFYRQCTGTIAAGSAPPQDAPSGSVCPSGTVMISWDPTGHTGSGASIAIPDTSGNGITLNVPNATFVTTPVYNPGCVPGPAQSVALGNSLTLNGSGSVPLNNNNVLTCHWDPISSSEPGLLPNQTGLTWTPSQNVCNPVVGGLARGPANFQLTVTDSSSNVSVCAVHDGAINVDGAGNVIYPTDSTGSLAKIGKLLGPNHQFGNKPTWPAVDTLMQQWADTTGSYQGQIIPGGRTTVWQDTWNTALTGTVGVTNAVATVSGDASANLDVVFCGGSGNTTPISGINVVIWPTYPITGGGGGTSRASQPVTGCSRAGSLTSLTVPFGWANPTQSGMSFSVYDQATQGSWLTLAGFTVNYYDSVVMFAAMYNRTGIDTYLHNALWLADRWWTIPGIDRGNGNNCGWDPTQCDNSPVVPRNASWQGLYFAALWEDYLAGTAGASTKWPGIRTQNQQWEFGMQTSLIGDLRESSYNDIPIALCAAYYPDNTTATGCVSWLDGVLNGFWKNQRTNDGHWQAMQGYSTLSQPVKWKDGNNDNYGGTVTVNPSSGTSGCPGGNDCITITGATISNNYTGTSSTPITPAAGSVTVTTQSGLGYLTGNCALVTSISAPKDYFIGPITSYIGTTLVLTATAAAPTVQCSGIHGSTSHNDWQISSSTSPSQYSWQLPGIFGSWYGSNNAATREVGTYQGVLIDSTHIQLTTPYTDSCSGGGNSCSGRDWFTCSVVLGTDWCGWGTQPFMLGITAQMYYQMMQGFLRFYGTYSADYFLAESYGLDAVNWSVKCTTNGTGGCDPNVAGSGLKGLMYGTGFSICNPGAVDGSDGCRDAAVYQSRTTAMELMGALGLFYSYSPTAYLKANIDALVGPTLSFSPGDIGYDGSPAMDCQLGFNGGIDAKWPGFCFGMGRPWVYLGLFNMPSVIAQIHWGH